MSWRVCVATVCKGGWLCFVLLFVLLLGACGQKGALYMPAQAVNQSVGAVSDLSPSPEVK